MPKLELLASPPGTGKTFYCIEIFKKEILKTRSGIQSRSFFILPSREHADRIQNLILRKPVAGLFNAQLLTINDLAAKILGASATRAPSDTLRKGILREILEGEGRSQGLLFRYFMEAKRFDGFRELLVDAIKEFKTGLLTINEFERLSQILLKDPVFRSKFRDFSVVIKNYELRLAELGLKEPEDELLEALKAIPHAEPADLVIFDGFYHFTRAQKSLIQAIAGWSRHTVVTLTLADRYKTRPKLFEYPERTKAFLLQCGFKEKKNFFLTNHRTKDPALLHLEQNLFSDNPKAYTHTQNSVFLIEAPTLRAEVEMIAREIKKLHRETTCHFSDICLILRQVRGYENTIHSVFSDLDIPVHVHERKKLVENGFVRVLHRFLSLSLEGWKREDMMFILKCNYLSSRLTMEDALCLETLALNDSHSEGRQWWERVAEREGIPVNAKTTLQTLLKIEANLVSAATIREFNAHIISWLQFLQSEAMAQDPLPLDFRAIESVLSLLELTQAAYENSQKEDFSASSCARDLRESLEAGLFSWKPKGKNRVQVYDVVMALPKEYKAVFIPGLLEKVFPQGIAEDPLFKDSERRVMNRKEIVLEERLSRIAGERYFFYMAITRAKQRLYLSCPRYNAEGRAALASFFIEEVGRCFQEPLPMIKSAPHHFLPLPEEWESEYDVTRGLSEIIFRKRPVEKPSECLIHPLAAQVLNQWMHKENFKEILRFGFSKDEARLRDPKVRRFFQDLKGPFSATKLETFATCAFKYFLSRVLTLNETLDGREAMEMGNLLHKTLEEFYKELPASEKESGDFLKRSSATEAALHKKLEALMSESLFIDEPLYRQRMHVNSMKGTLSLFVRHEKALFEKRSLVPTYLELKFGKPETSDLDYLKIEAPGGAILIEGQIDRVDISKEKSRALVIDYKRSAREFTVHEKLKNGLEFQLPIYILAVRRLLHLEVVGAEIRVLRDAVQEGIYKESAGDVLGLHAKARRYTEGEFETVLKKTEDRIRQNLKRLREADNTIDSKSCKFCSFSSVCRFEPWRLVYS